MRTLNFADLLYTPEVIRLTPELLKTMQNTLAYVDDYLSKIETAK